MGNYWANNQGLVAFGQFITGTLVVEGKVLQSVLVFGLIQLKFEGKLNFEVKSSFGIVQQYGKDDKGFYVENKIKFSGLKVKLDSKAKLTLARFTIFEYENEDTEEKTILKSDTVSLFKIYLFKV